MIADMMGKEIREGDYLAVAGRYSSSCWLDISLVLEVQKDKVQLLKYNRYEWEDVRVKKSYVNRSTLDRAIIISNKSISSKILTALKSGVGSNT